MYLAKTAKVNLSDEVTGRRGHGRDDETTSDMTFLKRAYPVYEELLHKYTSK